MSSNPSNTQEKRMSSITRRLKGSWVRRSAARIAVSTVLLFFLSCAGWLITEEYRALGFIKWNVSRSLVTERTVGGRITELYYRIMNAGEDPINIAVGRVFIVLLIIFACILIVRLLYLFFVTSPREDKRIREILSPLTELALKADELSRLEFGEDKYHVLEDAISHLDADDARLSLGDSDLLGIEAAINNLLTRIRESNRQQARFVNDASHELRTPIAVISGYADMLARWGKNDEKVLNESIAAIQTESERMKHLVEQLLFLARGDSGKTQLQKEDVNINDLIREVYEESVMIDEKHIYRFSPSEKDIIVSADPGLLKQAVRILTDNAAKYTKEKDEILLSCGEAEGRPYLQVQDCGIGMAESDMIHIFERFYRADKARSIEGTGLGLSIAKWIIDKHKGHFEILSRQNIGTRIRIVL